MQTQGVPTQPLNQFPKKNKRTNDTCTPEDLFACTLLDVSFLVIFVSRFKFVFIKCNFKVEAFPQLSNFVGKLSHGCYYVVRMRSLEFNASEKSGIQWGFHGHKLAPRLESITTVPLALRMAFDMVGVPRSSRVATGLGVGLDFQLLWRRLTS